MSQKRRSSLGMEDKKVTEQRADEQKKKRSSPVLEDKHFFAPPEIWTWLRLCFGGHIEPKKSYCQKIFAKCSQKNISKVARPISYLFFLAVIRVSNMLNFDSGRNFRKIFHCTFQA